ncbi:hypothetical protein [Bacteriovorax sp. Seq25_V]|uniref:hypothetical protein n=1 Tax=Bacteriovorax sp. Seq25_V TaxID=1201288 RepID=UPI00038A431B|nr:hypothetical protein [Bacteriovorax sp. Seq25_V]EQC47593.1 hypothetical protein M900_0806 [Bacteriovorax sp. Seq25_V]
MSSENLSTPTKKGMTPASITFNVTPVQTLRKRSSLRPKRSILKVKSLRPTKALLRSEVLSEETKA